MSHALALAESLTPRVLPIDIALTPDGTSLAIVENGNQRVKVRLSALRNPTLPGCLLHRCAALLSACIHAHLLVGPTQQCTTPSSAVKAVAQVLALYYWVQQSTKSN